MAETKRELTPTEIMNWLKQRGLTAILGDDGEPRLRGNKAAVTPGLLAAIKRRRDDIVAALRPALPKHPGPCPPFGDPAMGDWLEAIELFNLATTGSRYLFSLSEGEPLEANAALERNFTYHTPKPGRSEKYGRLRDKAKELAYLMLEVCPQGRERSVAYTHLETAVMWANAAIARGEEVPAATKEGDK